MKILVTGFKPFLGDKINPSESLAIELAKNFASVEALILPVEFGRSFQILKAHLQKKSYDYILLLGLASTRTNVCLEKIALNWVQTEHADEAGVRPAIAMIDSSLPLALMTKLPIDEVFAVLKNENLPVEISFSAGTYVCNDLYFRCLSQFAEEKIIFIHVPSEAVNGVSLNVLKQVITLLN